MQTRECGDCSLCCKLPEINYFKTTKKSYQWCKSCDIGLGCKIYDKRPKGCRDFWCLYQKNLIDLKPNKVGFFIFGENESSLNEKVLTIYTESSRLEKIPYLIMKDRKGKMLVDDGWVFHIRYNSDDNNIAIFDLKLFGMNVKKMKRNIPFEEQLNA